MSEDGNPKIQAARLSHTAAAASATSGTHRPVAVGYLAVRVTFLGEPVRRLKVELFQSQPDGKKGDAVSPDGLQTDDRGFAAVPDPVEVGNYWCAIENQPETLITTVDALNHPLEIPLPVGRAHHDIR